MDRNGGSLSQLAVPRQDFNRTANFTPQNYGIG